MTVTAEHPPTAPALTPERFGALFEEHARAIYNYCYRRLGDWSVAEDLTSVVFLEAWRRHADVDLEGEPALPWLYGVATNVLRNQRRTSRRHRAALARMPAAGDTPDFAADAAARVDGQRDAAGVIACVRRLPRADQEVLVLCLWEGLSYAEAARALDLPVGTVRSRLARARDRIAADLPSLSGADR